MKPMDGKKQTAVMWLLSCYVNDTFLTPEMFQKALAMEKEQHGETWDNAIISTQKRALWAQAMCDFDEYWESKGNDNEIN